MQLLVLILLAVGTPAGLLLLGVADWRWLSLGAGAWLAAVAIKVLAGLAVARALHLVSSERVRAGVWGGWSALCELGAAGGVFLLADPPPGLGDVVGFGVGAGAFEVAVVLGVILLAAPQDAEEPRDRFVAWSCVLERASALCGHVGSRGLVWLGLSSPLLVPLLLLGLGTFALVDGVATYGQAVEWDWCEPRLCRRFQGFCALVAGVEMLAFGLGCLLMQSVL